MSADRIKVMLAFPSQTVYRSTDRTYLYRRFSTLAGPYPIDFIKNDSKLAYAKHSLDYLLSRIGVIAEPRTVILPAAARADLVFSYGLYPRHKPEVPLIWEQNFAANELRYSEAEWKQKMLRDRVRGVETADAIVTSTTESARQFREIFPQHANKLWEISYYFPHIEPIPPALLEKRQEQKRPMRFLFVGREANRKGLDIILKAYERLSPALRREVQFTVVSDMLDGRLALPGEFRHYSAISDEALEALYRSSDVFVFPTKREAFGLVLAEAMAAGNFIITSKCPIQRSIVSEEGASVIDPFDVAEMERAIRQAVDQRASLLTRGLKNREKFLRIFYHREVGRRYFELFRALADRAASPGLSGPLRGKGAQSV